MSARRAFRAVLCTLLAFATALPLLAAPASADPVQTKPSFTAERGEHQVTVRVAGATVAIEDGKLVFRSPKGATLDTVPLTYIGTDARTYPIDATVTGAVATLVPSKDVARSTTTPESVLNAGKTAVAKKQDKQKVICGPQTKKQRDKEALQTLQSELGTAATIGGVGGAIVGLIVGLVGGPLAPVAGLIGAAVGAAGGIAGAALNGAFARYFGTINQKNFKPKTCYI